MFLLIPLNSLLLRQDDEVKKQTFDATETIFFCLSVSLFRFVSSRLKDAYVVGTL
jgi:hypothetical protein